MLSGGATCAWYDTTCQTLMNIGVAGATITYSIGELINYAASCIPQNYHGNDLRNTKTNYGYTLRNKSTGEVLKYGETINPDTRYSTKYLEQNNAYMQIETTGSKLEIHNWQHEQILNYKDMHDGLRPLLNKSDW